MTIKARQRQEFAANWGKYRSQSVVMHEDGSMTIGNGYMVLKPAEVPGFLEAIRVVREAAGRSEPLNGAA